MTPRLHLTGDFTYTLTWKYRVRFCYDQTKIRHSDPAKLTNPSSGDSVTSRNDLYSMIGTKIN